MGVIESVVLWEPLRLFSLEFNLHQLILSDLAKSISAITGEAPNTGHDKSIEDSIEAISSRVEIRVKPEPNPHHSEQQDPDDVISSNSPGQSEIDTSEDDEIRVFMVCEGL